MTNAFAAPATHGASKLLWRSGWALSGLFVLFMIPDIAIKLIQSSIVADAMIQLGYQPQIGFWIGVLEAVLLVLYVTPQTTVLGAVLFTGLFGGAIASHMRIGSPVFSHDLFGVYLGLIAWGGLWLRDESLRALFPLRR